MKQILKNLWLDIKSAATDTVDLIMFIILILFSILDLAGVDLTGAVGFITFYVMFLLIRLGGAKRMLKDKELIK